MSKLVQFTDVHFPDLNPNSYENLNIMKLDLNVFTILVQITRSFSLSLQIRVIYKFLPSVLLCIF